MILSELILTKEGKSPLFNYYPYGSMEKDIFKEAMVKEGWTAVEQEVTFEEYNETAMSAFLGSFAYRFHQKGEDYAGF